MRVHIVVQPEARDADIVKTIAKVPGVPNIDEGRAAFFEWSLVSADVTDKALETLRVLPEVKTVSLDAVRSIRDMNESDYPPPNPSALENAAKVRAAGKALNLYLVDEGEDVLGGFGLWYSWPPSHPEGDAERWAWIGCMNSGAITCVMNQKVKPLWTDRSFTFRTDHLDEDMMRVVQFLNHGEKRAEEANVEKVTAAAKRLGLTVRNEGGRQIAGMTILFLHWPSTSRRRSAWVGCSERGYIRCFFYEHDQMGPNQTGGSYEIRHGAFDHDMKIVWRFLKWGRR